MNILKNLLLIDKYGLPHPQWQIVKSSKELKEFYKIKDYCGWTIRVFYTKNKKFRPPLYDNWIAKKKVPALIDAFAKKAKNDFKIAVYPSWKLQKSGTLLLDKKNIIIEACAGHVSNLIRLGNCRIRLIYNDKNRLITQEGDKNFLSPAQRQKILLAGKIGRRGIILEWAIGKKNEFIFYKWEGIREAGQKLLAKYS